MDVLATINHSLTLVSRLREISKHLEEAEFKNLLADLSMELADAKLKIAELKTELAERTQELAALKSSSPAGREKPSGIKWGCYQFEGLQGLYCTACYDSKGQKSLTNRLSTNYRSCPVCKAMIGAG